MINNNGITETLTHLSPSAEHNLPLTTASRVTVAGSQSETITLKKIIKYIIGVSVLGGVIYSFLKVKDMRGMSHKNSLKSIDDNISSVQPIAVIDKMARKSRHIYYQDNHPYNYYYSKNQSAKCQQQDFLVKCEREHKKIDKGKNYYTSLVLNVGYMPCLCPPPKNKNVNIIIPPDNYTYTDKQPRKCKIKRVINTCHKYHYNLKNKLNKLYENLNFTVGHTLCYCPPPKWQLVNIISPNIQSNINVFLNNTEPALFITDKQKRVLSLQTKNKTDVNNSGVVNVKQKYDFLCVTESEHITLSQALKVISQTLRNPISMLTAESMKIHYHNTLQLGCPSKNTMDKVNVIAVEADKYLNSFMQMLPKNKSIMITQNIIAPLLLAISQEIDGNPVQIDLIDEINSNVLFIFRDFTRLISDSDISEIKSMDYDDAYKYAMDNFNKKFFVNENGLNVKYKKQNHALKFDFEKRPYIENEGGSIFIDYNFNDEAWDETDFSYQHFYTEENIKSAKEYSINDIYREYVYNIDDAKNSAEEEIFASEHKFPVQSVFIAENIIPVYKLSMSFDEDTFITAIIDLPKKIIVKTPFGFVFDKESTDVSYLLGLYIENNIHSEDITEVNRYSKIHKDKFSYNRTAKKHIKYKNKYYPVHGYDNAYNVYYMISDKYNEVAYITLKESAFDFHDSTIFNSLDFFKEDTVLSNKINDGYFNMVEKSVDFMPVRSEGERSGYIHLPLYDDLLNYGKVYLKDVSELQQYDSFIYNDKKTANHYLNVNDRLYLLTQDSDFNGIISVQKKALFWERINIYRHHDILMRTKKNNVHYDYIRISHCGVKRDLTELSCIPIYINNLLKEKLDNNIKNSYSVAINDEGVKIFDRRPGFFYRQQKIFYFYNGHFFEVKINLKQTEKNNLPHDVIDVYAKSIFRNKRKIASFVFEKTDERIELKEPDVFLAEMTGNGREDMELLLANEKYYHLPNVFDLNNAINEVNRSQKLMILLPKEAPDIVLGDEDILNFCHESFYDKNTDIKFTLLKMDEVTPEDDFHIWSGKIKADRHLKYAREVLTKSIYLLRRPSLDLDEYLKSILKTDNTEIVGQFSDSLRVAFDKTLKKLDSKYIYLVSAIKEPYENSPVLDLTADVKSPVHYKKVLDEVSSRSGTFALATKIKDSRIYICTDKFYFIDPTHPDTSLHQSNELDLAETLIHEATHAGYGADDNYYMPHEFDGLLKSVMESRNKFINDIPRMKEKHLNRFRSMVREYVETLSIYEPWKIKLLTDKELLSLFISKDIGVMANLYLKTADFLTKICKDIYHLDVVDKGSLHYYSHFLNLANTMMTPVMNLLDVVEDDIRLDISEPHDALPASVAEEHPLYTINEEEEPVDLDGDSDKKIPADNS